MTQHENSINGNSIEYFQPADKYWGLGIECETYFQIGETLCRGDYLKTHIRRNLRRSDDYTQMYPENSTQKAYDLMFQNNATYRIPRILDRYSIDTVPDMQGQTLNDKFMAAYPTMAAAFRNKNYLYDASKIEFVTRNFYKSNVSLVVRDLISTRNNFMSCFSEYMQIDDLQPMMWNYGLVQYFSNSDNIEIYNIGSYHLNLTLPTKLDSHAEIANSESFIRQHQMAIRVVQWMQPFLMAIYGSPDFLSLVDNESYAAGSLRCLISQYLSIGTYDSDLMMRGKLAGSPREQHDVYHREKSWYQQLAAKCKYQFGPKIGFDVNFAKHYQSGIEFRFPDYFPTDCLEDFLNLIVLLMAHSLTVNVATKPVEFALWHDFTAKTFMTGCRVTISAELVTLINAEVALDIAVRKYSASDYLTTLTQFLWSKYRDSDCCQCFSPNMPLPRIWNVNLAMWHANYLQYLPVDDYEDARVEKLYQIYQSRHTVKSDNDYDMESLCHVLNIEPDLTLEEFHGKIISTPKISIDKYLINQA